MDVYDVTEALCIGKNRGYELLGAGTLKGFRIGRGLEDPAGCHNGIYLNAEQIE